MEVYRICLEEYSRELFASSYRGRWNSKGNFVIYTAGSRALACLENVVHRSGEGLNSNFRVVIIKIPDDMLIETIEAESLPEKWYEIKSYTLCQVFGNAWYQAKSSAVLRVPSSIIQNEYNYILNTRHPEFGRIKIVRWEPFEFDPRIKAQ
jgi:RES domain-containing protein